MVIKCMEGNKEGIDSILIFLVACPHLTAAWSLVGVGWIDKERRLPVSMKSK